MKPTHAGGIVLRETNGSKEFLLISAKNFPFIWVLPKGHIKIIRNSSKCRYQRSKRRIRNESFHYQKDWKCKLYRLEF
jgi:hypothetical protein